MRRARGLICNENKRGEKNTKNFNGKNLRGKDHLGDPLADGRIKCSRVFINYRRGLDW
jgi:hypothetical protein